MLKKLAKQEWRQFSRIPSAILIYLIAITFAGVVFFFLPIWDMAGIPHTLLDSLLIAGFMFYLLSLMVCASTIPLYTAYRYYTNMYGDEGYLTHTLPVTSRQLILSRLGVAYIWTVISFVGIAVSVFVLILAAAAGIGELTLGETMAFIPRFINEFSRELGMNFWLFFLPLFLMLIVGAASSHLLVYVCISLGQMFHRHKLAGAFLFFGISYFVMQFIFFLAMLPMMARTIRVNYEAAEAVKPGMLLFPFYWVAFVLSILLLIGLYFWENYLVERKLNLE